MKRSARRAQHGVSSNAVRVGRPNGGAPVSFSNNEWGMLRSVRPNILIIGADEALASTVSALVAELPGPVSYLGPNDAPPVRHEVEMLVLPDVAVLSTDRQHEWMTWMSDLDGRRPQIVATSRVPVYPLVQTQIFLETLYYRLNTILLEMQVGDSPYRRYFEL